MSALSALLLARVIGSGIMGERLAGGNVAIALLGNAIPTGATLVVLITALAPISGAHFNRVADQIGLRPAEVSVQCDDQNFTAGISSTNRRSRPRS
jgi:hypothetical protein